jgi:hypothetical protein
VIWTLAGTQVNSRFGRTPAKPPWLGVRCQLAIGHRLELCWASCGETTAGKWITHPPTRCLNGHEFAVGKVLVGYQACLGHGGGHTTWTCRTCDQTVYGPPLASHCSMLDGPAPVSLSNLT